MTLKVLKTRKPPEQQMAEEERIEMTIECRRRSLYLPFFCLILAALFSFSGCSNPEKAKAEHLSRGEAYLKELKFQEASLEFRNALQIDDKLAAAHWGLARSYEGLERFAEMMDELRKTRDLDPNNLEARVRLGNYYVVAATRNKPELWPEAQKIADEILQKDPNYIEGHILQGTIYFNQNKREEAFKELNRAIEIDPNRAESYLSLARFYIVTNDNSKAEELLKKAISVNGNSPIAHTEYARFLVQTNRLPEAEAEFRKAVDVAPTNRDARLALGRFYYANKRFDQAEEVYKGIVALDPNKPENQAMLGDFYAEINRTDESVRIYNELLAKSPDYAQGRYRLAEILLGRGDTVGATAQIDEALKRDQHDRQALLLRARLRGQSGQVEGLKAAIEDLKDVLRQDPTSEIGLYFMAQSNFNLGLMDQARAFTTDLEKNYPDFLPAKLIQLQITLATGDAKQASSLASDLLNRLDKVVPDRISTSQLLTEIRQKTHLAKGAAEVQLGDLAGARKDFEMARDTAPNDPNSYNSLAILSLRENKRDDAISLFETALKVDPTNLGALNGLISIYAGSKEFDKAHSRIDMVVAANPNNASLHFLKAQVYGFQHDASGAEAELNKAIELDSNYLPAYSALGALFINSKQEDRAIAQYQKILAIRPDNATAYTLIGMLEDARKNYDVAADNYRKALEKDPNAMIAANNLAWLYATTGKGNLDEAVRLAQGVVQKNPNIAGFIDTLGWVYYKKNLYAAAVEQLQKAVSVDEATARTANGTASPTYHYHLALALNAKGDKEGARRELQAAMRLGEKAPFADANDARQLLATL
jgi:tetratricopeptide (TPR) repeat protein